MFSCLGFSGLTAEEIDIIPLGLSKEDDVPENLEGILSWYFCFSFFFSVLISFIGKLG